MMRGRSLLQALLACVVAAAAFFSDRIVDALIFDRVAIVAGPWRRFAQRQLRAPFRGAFCD